ncbi:MAG: hydroxymethylbilane synthase, partial [Bacteroidetes bacterium]|nr:hydroxymethylbilane synthase [Bacteroidota bacterium]
LAVHSHKDLPTTNHEGLTIAAVSYREVSTETLLIRPEAFDAREKFGLKKAAIVGTSSGRRKSQLLFFRPDLETADLRGNVPTRIQKLLDGQYDAILLATAGLKRLNLQPEGLKVSEIPANLFIPAPAQGVLAFQVRENDTEIKEVLSALHHADVQDCISVERSVLNRLDGGCQLPLGVYCEKSAGGYRSWTSLKPLDGSPYRRFYMLGKNPVELSARILERLSQTENRSVFLSREPGQATGFIKQAQNFGFSVHAQSPLITETIEISHLPFTEWIFFSSPAGVEHFFSQDLIVPAVTSVAALGSGTAEALSAYGIIPSFTGGGGLLEETAKQFIEKAKGTEVFFPIGEDSLRNIQQLIAGEAVIHEQIIYRKLPNPDFIMPQADIAVFTSPALAKAALKDGPPFTGIAVAIGDSTAAELKKLGVQHVLTAPYTDMQSLADLVCGISV